MTRNETPRRVLVAKPGLDGHDRGAKVGVRMLRDAGMEVIYTGIRQTPAQIAEAALQEDVDVIVTSVLSGAHMVMTKSLTVELMARAMEDVHVIVAGTIPAEDIPKLMALGTAGVFPTGSDYQEIVEFIRTLPASRG